MVIEIPTFRGYIFDFRLKEIRNANLDRPLEFIEMYSPKGEKLLLDFLNNKNAVTQLEDYLEKHRRIGFDMSWWSNQVPQLNRLCSLSKSELF